MKASTWTKTGQGESHAEGDNNKSEISSSEPKRKHHCKFYAVSIGGMLGVFKDWGQCKKNVNEYSGNCYKGFNDKLAQVQFLEKAHVLTTKHYMINTPYENNTDQDSWTDLGESEFDDTKIDDRPFPVIKQKP